MSVLRLFVQIHLLWEFNSNSHKWHTESEMDKLGLGLEFADFKSTFISSCWQFY